MTEKLFRNDVYLTSCEATVTGTGDARGILLSRTVFFPEAGGQSSDIGTLTLKDGTEYPIVHVAEDGEDLYHKIGGDAALSEGDEVTVAIDWDHRFENMQRHCGEHILSGRFHALFQAANRGFHMGKDYITIDLQMPDEKEVLTMEMALQAEREANEIIWRDLPVHVDYFEDFEEARAMPLRKELTIDEDISVVTIGDREDPADCCACCGSHPSGTGQVGLLKVYKVEKNRGFWRVYFDAGKKAMDHYGAIAEVISDLSAAYSAPLENPGKILEKNAIEKEKQAKVHRQLADLRKGQTQRICDAAIKEALRDLQSWSSAPTTVTPAGIKAEDLDGAAKIMQDLLIGTVFLRLVEDCTVLLYSDGDFDCGAAVKEWAKRYGGKGGGSDVYARAIFPTVQQMDAFLAQFDCRADLMI